MPIALPPLRVRALNEHPVRNDAHYVLYWMTAFRRPGWNFALQRAAEWCAELGRPLLVLEALRCDYPWASARLHRFVLEGMEHNARAFDRGSVAYYPFVEAKLGQGTGQLEALADRACVVVGDDFPTFFLPRMLAAAARRVPVRLEAVDANGLLPMRAADREFPTAYAFRRFLQGALGEHLERPPLADPLGPAVVSGAHDGPDSRLRKLVSRTILDRWPAAPVARGVDAVDLDRLPIDKDVHPVPLRGGADAAHAQLVDFVAEGLPLYGERRNEPGSDVTSRLSPYLHFGHLSSWEVLQALAEQEDWSPADAGGITSGKRTGWWNMSPSAEGFLDQFVTWRELGFNLCCRRDDHDRYDSLPEWARRTLADHADDPRPHVYSLGQFEHAATHDELWNAAQGQLLQEGRIHNYLRMLWGKKILHWSRSPMEALEIMVHLNNKYALDGRDPNSYSGIFWCLGRYDRAWGPERPVFGKVRYMTSANTARKYRIQEYVQRYGPQRAPALGPET